MTIRSYDVAIVGAGGAGMMCAIHAAQRGRKVVLLDHTTKIGRKILISGGGRCNFTNTGATHENFVSQNPHFCKSALSRYTPQDFIDLVEKHEIPFHEKKLGQLFCDRSAEEIVDMLVKECRDAGATFELDCRVNSIAKNDLFVIETTRGAFICESVVIASGGLSIPQIGATGFGYEVARQFGLSLVKTSPALVGLTLNREYLQELSELSGLSIDSIATSNGTSFRENTLFTHDGLSGPAILQSSLYWNSGDPLTLDLMPGFDSEQWLFQRKSSGVKSDLDLVLAEKLPKRFADKFCWLNGLDRTLNQMNEREVKELAALLQAWTIHPSGSVGYKKAEVTRGGVNTNDLSSKTMAAKKVPGLYFIGEVVDVTGQLGGYNFQWAWASGFAAGQDC